MTETQQTQNYSISMEAGARIVILLSNYADDIRKASSVNNYDNWCDSLRQILCLIRDKFKDAKQFDKLFNDLQQIDINIQTLQKNDRSFYNGIAGGMSIKQQLFKCQAEIMPKFMALANYHFNVFNGLAGLKNEYKI